MKVLGVIFGALALVFGGTALIHFQKPIKEVLIESDNDRNLSLSISGEGEPRSLID